MFEASDRMNHLKKPKPRGQTLPPHAYNMDFSSSMRSNLSNFNSPQHLDDKIEEDQEDPNAGIELLERSDITNDEPVVEGKLYSCNNITMTLIQISGLFNFGFFSKTNHQMMINLTLIVSRSKSKWCKAQKVQKYALNSQLQALQILTNDDEVEN